MDPAAVAMKASFNSFGGLGNKGSKRLDTNAKYDARNNFRIRNIYGNLSRIPLVNFNLFAFFGVITFFPVLDSISRRA